MKNFSILNGKAARTTFFIVFVGGLFLFSAMSFENLCNRVIFNYFHVPCISTLEAAGMIAFAYIIYFGVKFGLKKRPDTLTEEDLSKSHISDNLSETCKENLKNMSEHEKTELQKKLQNSLGFNQKN